MLRLVLEGAGLTLWPTISLLIFFATTLGVLVWIYRPGSAEFYRRLGGLALEETSGRHETGVPETRLTRHIPPQNFPEN